MFMTEFDVVFSNGIEYSTLAESIPDVEDQLLDMGFSARDVATAKIFEVVSED